VKAITLGLASFARTFESLQIKSLAVRSDNSTAVFDIKKWKAPTTLLR
jgi:hypothetical protein